MVFDRGIWIGAVPWLEKDRLQRGFCFGKGIKKQLFAFFEFFLMKSSGPWQGMML